MDVWMLRVKFEIVKNEKLPVYKEFFKRDISTVDILLLQRPFFLIVPTEILDGRLLMYKLIGNITI